MTGNSVVQIDQEFKSLIPPLSAEEYAQLEANILAEGCRDNLVAWLMPTQIYCENCEKTVLGTRSEPKGWEYSGEGKYDNDLEKWVAGTWDDHVEIYDNGEGWPALFCPECHEFLDQGDTVLLDGHNRHEICKKHNLLFVTTLIELPDRQAAINWIINNQLGRRNLHPDQASYLRGKRYNSEKQDKGGDRKSKYQNDTLIESTADRLATEYKVSALTVKRDGNYAAAIDTLQAAGIAPQSVIAHDPKAAVVEFAKLITPEPKPPAAPLLPVEPPKPKDPVVSAVTEKVKRGEMTVVEAAKEIRQAKTEKRREERLEKIVEISHGNAELSTDIRYPVLYADPPWRYEHAESDSRAIENQYPTMALDDICALPVNDLATPDAILFLWATSPKLAESMKVIESWGFTYRTCAVWDKQKIGMGYYFRQRHELLLVATRGSIPTPAPGDRAASVIVEPREEHSAKPAKFAELIEAMYPTLPRIELFCRSPREGWAVWGNQSC